MCVRALIAAFSSWENNFAVRCTTDKSSPSGSGADLGSLTLSPAALGERGGSARGWKSWICGLLLPKPLLSLLTSRLQLLTRSSSSLLSVLPWAASLSACAAAWSEFVGIKFQRRFLKSACARWKMKPSRSWEVSPCPALGRVLAVAGGC